MTDLLRSLQDLFRLHPLPWRDNGIGYTDHNGHAVGFGLRVLAEHGYDIVSLVEQCAEHGAPEDIKADAAEEIAEFEKAATAAEEDLQDDLEDAEADVRRLESEVNWLERRVDELEDERNALREELDELRASRD